MTGSEGTPESLASELTLISGRLELLIAFLAGPAVRRRIGVEDLAQDAILQLLGSAVARSLRGAELWRYAQSVARHTVIDAARRLRHAPLRAASIVAQQGGVGSDSTGSLSVLSAQPARGPGPATHAAGHEQHARLLAAFDALTPEHRRVIGLRRFEGLSAAETAARMGRSEAAVHSLFRRALAAWADAIDV